MFKKSYIVSISIMGASLLYGDTLSDDEMLQEKPALFAWYIVIDSGYSWPMSTTMHVNSQWFNADQGYNQTLTPGPYTSMGFGIKFWDMLYLDTSYIYFATMHYQKYQSKSTVLSTLNANKLTRLFDYDAQSAIVNLSFYPGKYFGLTFWKMTVSPFIGAGAGVGINMVSNFHTVTYDATGQMGSTAELEFPFVCASFAWQGEAGVRLSPSEHMSFDIMYRYYNGGVFRTGSVLVLNTPSGAGNVFSTTHWRGVFQTNTLMLSCNFSF